MGQNDRSIEVAGRTVEQAIEKGLEQLGLSRNQADVEVLRQGSRGLLGLLSEDALVRVSPKSPSLPESEEAGELYEEEEEETGHPAGEQPTGDPDEAARLGVQVLQKLLHQMGLRARVTRGDAVLDSQTGVDAVLVNVSGDDLGGLIGRRGETLRDLQFLTCLMVSRDLQHWPNLMVDVEHYRARRERTLTDLARRMADQVRRSGESVALEPMPPNERRIVHLALRDEADVFTESIGQGERRKVTIFPKR
jgi:spoIIIJ-associated protein